MGLGWEGLYAPTAAVQDNFPKPGYAALRHHRFSQPHADYFLTLNLAKRGSGLEAPQQMKEIRAQWERLETEGYWLVRTAVVMPDHIHLLIQLDGQGSLSECVRLLKGRLSPSLRSARLAWQSGFFDHQLRKIDNAAGVFLYVYLNPYRAGLCHADQTWAGYYCAENDWVWFGELTKESLPQPEWLE